MLSYDVIKSFWYEDIMIACYLINLTYFSAINGDTQYEKWYDIFRTFGCAVFSYQSKEKPVPKRRYVFYLEWLNVMRQEMSSLDKSQT